MKNVSCHTCLLRHVFVVDWFAGPPRKLSSSIWSARFSLSVTEVIFVLFGSGSIELPLGSSGRVSGSVTTPRFASSADAVRRLSSQASSYVLHSRVCDFPGPGVSHVGHPGVLPISDQKALILSAFACTLCLAFRVHHCLTEVQVEVPLESPPVPSLLASLHLDDKLQVVRVFQSPVPYQNSISSLEPRPFPTVLQEVLCSTRCSDEASRPHQQPLIHLFVSLAARTSWSGINANTDSPKHAQR